MNLSDAEIAELADHEAVPLDLPRHIEAWVTLRVQGRIDLPSFTVTLAVEPLQYAHAWVNYRRDGALLAIGERQLRLTPRQLAIFKAVDVMRAAGDSVEARLRAWPALIAALHGSSRGRVRLQGELPRVLLQQRDNLPSKAMTRQEGRLRRVSIVPQASWAMGPGHRYYLRAAA